MISTTPVNILMTTYVWEALLSILALAHWSVSISGKNNSFAGWKVTDCIRRGVGSFVQKHTLQRWASEELKLSFPGRSAKERSAQVLPTQYVRMAVLAV